MPKREPIVHTFAIGTNDKPLCGLSTSEMRIERTLENVNCMLCHQEVRRLDSLGAVVGARAALAPEPEPETGTHWVIARVLDDGAVIERMLPVCGCGTIVADLELHRKWHEDLKHWIEKAARR